MSKIVKTAEIGLPQYLADKGNAMQVQLLDQGKQLVDMGFERVLAILGGKSLLPKPMWSGTMTRQPCENTGMNLRLDVSPGWLAMQENNRVATKPSGT